ncbi:MAG: AbrB/MazE/SpoVT family DNA-binding domain-containing protein [Gordonibacter sp.]|uniref:AbrB/MazE/SpoVT family DNA-binding domain-containing protein n=1 Tax=Gordonibacter sp. TaxID=1968902 RepID=UPI002FC82C63
MAMATLSKWGNSQGIIIPRSICENMGISIGDRLDIKATEEGITLKPQCRTHRRARKLTAEEVFAGWQGEYVAPSDWPQLGREIDWGASAGKEIW